MTLEHFCTWSPVYFYVEWSCSFRRYFYLYSKLEIWFDSIRFNLFNQRNCRHLVWYRCDFDIIIYTSSFHRSFNAMTLAKRYWHSIFFIFLIFVAVWWQTVNRSKHSVLVDGVAFISGRKWYFEIFNHYHFQSTQSQLHWLVIALIKGPNWALCLRVFAEQNSRIKISKATWIHFVAYFMIRSLSLLNPFTWFCIQ